MVKYSKEFDCSDRNIKLWMEKVQALGNEFRFDEEFIFNFDETSIQIDDNHLKVLSTKEIKPIVKKNPSINHLTLGITICQDGSILKPLLVSKRKKGALGKMEKLNFEYLEYYSKTGWINQVIFFNYFSDYFLKKISKKRKKLKKENAHVIVFIDNHSSHFDEKLCFQFFRNNIHLILLPPNCTHILQPLDIGFFSLFQVLFQCQC